MGGGGEGGLSVAMTLFWGKDPNFIVGLFEKERNELNIYIFQIFIHIIRSKQISNWLKNTIWIQSSRGD